MLSRDERLVENQREFRYANERLDELVAQRSDRRALVPFFCECADERCLARIEMTVEDYEAAHMHSDYYIVLMGHPRTEGEELIEDKGSYQVLEKV